MSSVVWKRPVVIFASIGAVLLVGATWFSLFDIQVKPRKEVLAMMTRRDVSATPSPTASSALTASQLAPAVIPARGYTVDMTWGDIGERLVAAGAIDMAKYEKNYADPGYQPLLAYLTGSQNKGITINQGSAYFWVNTLWALGLTQKSDVLEKGVMGTEYAERIGNFASTGGWTLGAKDAVDLYSSAEIIPLTAEEQERIMRISQGIYRPCCGNPTSFPDCNHGMAILGLIELMVGQGFSDAEIYRAALAFTSYWFPQTYIDLAYYFQTREQTPWASVDPRRVLSAQFSSAQGYQAIKQQIGTVPGAPVTGGSCGA